MDLLILLILKNHLTYLHYQLFLLYFTFIYPFILYLIMFFHKYIDEK